MAVRSRPCPLLLPGWALDMLGNDRPPPPAAGATAMPRLAGLNSSMSAAGRGAEHGLLHDLRDGRAGQGDAVLNVEQQPQVRGESFVNRIT